MEMKAYRYEWKSYSQLCGEDEFQTVSNLELQVFPVIKLTPKGFVIEYIFRNRFVKISNRVQFAHLTKEEAFKAYLHRRNYYKNILLNRLKDVELSLSVSIDDVNKSFYLWK